MRNVLLFALLLMSNLVFAQLLTFDFAGTPGNQATSTSNFNANGVASSSISRGPGITADANADRFNSTNFSTPATPAIDLNDFLEFAITPVSSTVTITGITIQGQRSNTGPNQFVIRTSIDEFASNATAVQTTQVGNNQTFTLTFVFPTSIVTTAPITIRLFAFGATNGNGAFGPEGAGNDIIVNGTAVLNSPLPVKFANVRATKRVSGIEVGFSNLTESDVINYTIERSANGQQFTSIREMAPAKNDGGSVDYRFVDVHPLSSINYYRIKVTEQAGKTSYSIPVKLNTGLSQAGITIYPNPVKGTQLSFQVENLEAGAYRVAIFNAAGQVVTSQQMNHGGGSLGQTIPVHHLKRSIYYLEIDGTQKLRKSFVVQ